MSALDDHLKKHRQRIIDREGQTFREMLAAYDDIKKELNTEFKILQKQILDAKKAGETINESWLYRERRLKKLLDQVKSQVKRFGGTAARITAREQKAFIDIAVSQAKETVNFVTRAAGVSDLGMQFNPRVVETAVGMMGDGSPILEYYQQNLAPRVAELIKQEVIKAAASGRDFATIAKRLTKTTDITRSRALAIARTEVNRVRRETTRQFFEDNSDVITGWEWIASKSSRTCPACLAQDGKIYATNVVFPQHINCRCTMIAVIDGVPRPKRTLGSEWFARSSDEVKEEILGKDAFAAFGRGEVELGDFVGWATDKRFGKRVYTKKLSEALMNAGGTP